MNDPKDAALTCIQLEHAAAAYHNYFGYINTWTGLADNGTGQVLIVISNDTFSALTRRAVSCPTVERRLSHYVDWC